MEALVKTKIVKYFKIYFIETYNVFLCYIKGLYIYE